MAQLIASTTDAATSADFTLAAGESATISLFNTNYLRELAMAHVQIKGSDGAYYLVQDGGLSATRNTLRITAAGTYRISKDASQTAFGVDKV